MEALQAFWAEWGTVITAVLGSGVGALIMGFISSLVSKIVANRITGKFDVNKIVAEVTERVTQNVVQAITGSTLDVDISAVVEEKLDEVLGEITVEIKDVKQAVDSMRKVSALTAKAVSKSKLLDTAERAELTAAGETLEASATRADKPVMKVRVEAKNNEAKPAAKPAGTPSAIAI